MAAITEAHRQQYREQGYFTLEKALSEVWLEKLRAEVARFKGLFDENMRRSYLIQYSTAPILKADGSGPFNFTRRVLRDGTQVCEDEIPIMDPEEVAPH